ncbi:hypothetical protein GPECTOR_21g610 [Gonium pectorale]|uniref:AAA+ ATPase domain-containing protein n=1 Tax=Gonium pectorale TaxID=33097 RepID=A0A150GHU2_GONPE|nr:hypothetical protein GPECTOR_21g610 [Gonium pectorale]|eukprot:KXZ49384.1 hypothetical protein GPECTOR_21g610 [Gonium pectorale]
MPVTRRSIMAAAAAAAATPAVEEEHLGTTARKKTRASRATSNAADMGIAQNEKSQEPNALTDQEVAAIRRLLMPGALAGTLMSCAAAAEGPDRSQSAEASGGNERLAEPAGRGGQFKELHRMVSECCSSGRGAAVYISGLPGTGKTYTVSRLLASLPALAAASSSSANAPASGSGDSSGGPVRVSFCCATLNCMTLDDPAQLYARLQDELSRSAAAAAGDAGGSGLWHSKAAPPTSAAPADPAAAYDSLLSTLHKLSDVRPAAGAGSKTSGKAKGGASKGTKRGRGADAAAGGGVDEAAAGPQRRVFVVVLDEVDRLLRRRDGGEELARLFQLPATPGVSVVLLAVANSLDLTERMMPQLRARGLTPRHMVFTAYSRPQVLSILSAQLSAHPRGRRTFDDAALDMIAKSVSSSSGDLRQALKACRTALDVLAEHNRANPSAPRASAGIREVHAALQRLSSSGNGQPAVVAKIKGLPPQQQLVLLALATAVGARAAAAGGEAGSFQPGGALFTGARPKFADTVAFREISNQQGTAAGAANPGACFDGPTPNKPGRPAAGGAAGTPNTTRVRGVTGPAAGGAGAATPGSCAGGRSAGPPSRTPASILAGDAGLALTLADVYGQYGSLCRQLDIPSMSESAFRTDALPGLECDGLLKLIEGRTPAASRLSLRAMVRDVQTALADNVMFKRLMGARAPVPVPGAGQA